VLRWKDIGRDVHICVTVFLEYNDKNETTRPDRIHYVVSVHGDDKPIGNPPRLYTRVENPKPGESKSERFPPD
jgi:hypothetical protein